MNNTPDLATATLVTEPGVRHTDNVCESWGYRVLECRKLQNHMEVNAEGAVPAAMRH